MDDSLRFYCVHVMGFHVIVSMPYKSLQMRRFLTNQDRTQPICILSSSTDNTARSHNKNNLPPTTYEK
uniref:Ovule protein n=1 Tax=Meloidogyne incognita TaxID=6306 RepID=A0A914ME39_MELIC